MTKQTFQSLQEKGFYILAYSSGGDLLVQSFKARFRGRIVFGWFSYAKGVYEITPK